MKRRLLAMLLVLGLLFGFSACFNDGEAPADGTDETEVPDVPTPVEKNALETVYDLGALGDGENDDSSYFSVVGTDWLVVPAGRYKIARSINVTRSLILEPGAVIEFEVGVAAYFKGYVEASEGAQIFRNGRVTMEKNNICYPEWFGAVADGVTDCTSAIQQAINSFPNGYGKIVFSGEKYLVSDTIRIRNGQDHLTLEGIVRHTRENAPTILIKDSKKACLEIKGASSDGDYSGSLEDVTVRNMEFSRVEMGGVDSDTIYIESTLYTTLENVGFSKSQNGVRVVGGNGIRFDTCHGTTGGDLPGKEVRGIYIDGVKRGSTGILIDDYIYYGYGSPNSITYGYKDYNAAGSTGGTTGDRRITNFECSGEVDFGIAILSGSCGWSCDVSISAITMDGVKQSGIYLWAAGSRTFQQANIVNAYFRLGKEGAEAVTVDTYSNAHISNLMVDNAVEGAKNTGVSFSGANGGIVTNTAFAGLDYKTVVDLDHCSNVVVSNNTSIFEGTIRVKDSSNCIVTANAMQKVKLNESGNTNSLFQGNLFGN